MKALITGGAGFIGSHLADALLGRGDEVYVMDDLSTGSIRNIEHLKSHPKFHYKIDSIVRSPILPEFIDECDVVYHLAAAVGVKFVIESPIRTIHTNLKGAEVVLEAACKKKKKVLLASTSEVYAKNEKSKFSETDNLWIGQTSIRRWSYSCSKIMDEFLAFAYWEEKKQPVVIARIFNTVGIRQTGRYGMVVPSLVCQALAGESITVYGAGGQTRCFNHVTDTVTALILLMDASESDGQVFNVGSDEEISIMDLARRIKELSRSRSPIKLVPYAEAYETGFEDMMKRVPDLEKITRLTRYKNRYHLDDILKDVIAFERRAFDARL